IRDKHVVGQTALTERPATEDERPRDTHREQSKCRCTASLAQEVRVDNTYLVAAFLQEALNLERPHTICVLVELTDDQNTLTVGDRNVAFVERPCLLTARPLGAVAVSEDLDAGHQAERGCTAEQHPRSSQAWDL